MGKWEIRQFQHAMDAGETTSLQIIKDCLQQIEQIDQGEMDLHAIIELNPDVLKISTQLDVERSQGRIRGPLHGIPIILKANIDTADGMATTAGSLALKGSISEKDAFLVSRLREAGAIILGKTNLSEWANFRGARSVSGWSSLGGTDAQPA